MLTNLKKSVISIGFTYVQLPHEKKPSEIWPWMIWEDVSTNYFGVFFRVVGGEAASFGEIQLENTTRIDKVESIWTGEPKFADKSEKKAEDEGRN